MKINLTYFLISVAIMALVTYLPRMLPLVIFRKKINNRYVRSFLNYVPYAVLAAMPFPAIFSATSPLCTGWLNRSAGVGLLGKRTSNGSAFRFRRCFSYRTSYAYFRITIKGGFL